MSAAKHSIYAAVVTPVDASGEISVERFTRHARWLLRQGCTDIGIFGTTSETQAFSVAERQNALDAYLASGLSPAHIMLGVGCCARADTVALVKHALGHGITKLLALPPFFYKNNTDEGLVRAFSEVVEQAGSPSLELYLYHFPQVSQVPITRGVIDGLLKRYPATLRGLKDSSGDLPHTLGLIEAYPELRFFAGADQHLLDVLKAGGAGSFSAAANLNCAANRRVLEAFQRGDLATAEKEMASVGAVRGVLQRYPLMPGIKHVISAAMKDPVWATVRPPLVELDEARGKSLVAELEAAGYVYDPDLYSVAAA